MVANHNRHGTTFFLPKQICDVLDGHSEIPQKDCKVLLKTFYLLENIAFVIIGAKSNDKCEISKRFADFCVLSLKKKRKKKRFYSKGKISKNRIWEGFHNQWIIYTQPDLWFSNHYLTNYTSYITGCWPCSCRR